MEGPGGSHFQENVVVVIVVANIDVDVDVERQPSKAFLLTALIFIGLWVNMLAWSERSDT